MQLNSYEIKKKKNLKYPKKCFPSPPLLFCSNLGVSIVIGKIRTAPASAGSCSAQGLGLGKVQTFRAELI